MCKSKKINDKSVFCSDRWYKYKVGDSVYNDSFIWFWRKNTINSICVITKYLEYNVNKVIEYYNDFKEEKYEIKKDSKRYLAKQIK